MLFALLGSQQGTVFTLKPPGVSIGCDDGADVRLDDDAVSGRHARLMLGSDGASIEDLGSRNGTFVNEERVRGSRALADGDHLRFGSSTIVKFAMTDELEERALTTLFALTLRDPLTRLYNRHYFDDRLHSEFSFARSHGTLLALLLIDIDHFTAINHTWGHPMGDAVLRLAASSIERVMRPEDVLARFGGDEFVVIVRATSLRNAEILAERIRHRIEALTLEAPGRELTFTVSAGVALMGPDVAIDSAEALVGAADQALYRARVTGRTPVVACVAGNGLGHGQSSDAPSRRTQPPRG
jgi:diguanylate cyclase (GGDEF)-like protein